MIEMFVGPYIFFGGNCAEAIAFYEKAFGVKAEIMRYKDAPPSAGYNVSAGTEDFVLHGQISLGSATIMFCDTPPEYPVTTGDNIAVHVGFDDANSATAAFNALKDGGEVSTELEEVFWSKLFGSLTDKFGINWQISLAESK
jgi:PhnB protein